jgi:DNA-3-methyladenine glycosylase II
MARRYLAHFRTCDSALAEAYGRVAGYPSLPTAEHKRRTHFESLARAIVGQQLALKAAETIWQRYADLSPGPRPPRVRQVLGMSDRQLRGVGLSQNKMLAIQDLCHRIDDGRLHLPSIARSSDEQIIQRLTEVRGIGVWTGQMFLMFKLGRLDVMPTGDLGVQEGLRRLDQMEARPKPKELEQRAQVWAPYRSVAAWILWRLVDQAD